MRCVATLAAVAMGLAAADPAPPDPRRIGVERLRLAPTAQPLLWGDAAAGTREAPAVGADEAGPEAPAWRLRRGDGAPVDELQLAQLLGDVALQRRIAGGRRGARLHWGLALGLPSLAAGGAGGALLATGSGPDQGRRTVAVSLLTAAAVGAALSVLFPILRPAHVIDADQAEALCAAYNRQLPPLGLPAASGSAMSPPR